MHVFLAQHPDMRGRTVAYNVRVPLPFGLRDIEGRTETGFYRQISALRCARFGMSVQSS